ncbi:unnamed protein product [Brachionus calyciflorus]|uniref:Uncharacterized protein n=1 Tax=Brachionus calyciflorus TaxID=104777 RepID=A0A814JGL7_9BILA|nr:unnamed protein product [Brachionus calyciflorus]
MKKSNWLNNYNFSLNLKIRSRKITRNNLTSDILPTTSNLTNIDVFAINDVKNYIEFDIILDQVNLESSQNSPFNWALIKTLKNSDIFEICQYISRNPTKAKGEIRLMFSEKFKINIPKSTFSGIINSKNFNKYLNEEYANIYNFDETALFYRLEPDKTLDDVPVSGNKSIESNNEIVLPDIKEVIYYIRQAWPNVTIATIKNCWLKCGIIKDVETQDIKITSQKVRINES